jgi:hypothetical protein
MTPALQETPAPTPPCQLTTEGVCAFLASLGGSFVTSPNHLAVLDLAWHVAQQQIRIADEQWDTYKLWFDGTDQWGVINPEGHLRQIKRSYTGTHWHVETPYMKAISRINSALTNIAFKYSQREKEVETLRPNPKHVFIYERLRESGATIYTGAVRPGLALTVYAPGGELGQ